MHNLRYKRPGGAGRMIVQVLFGVTLVALAFSVATQAFADHMGEALRMQEPTHLTTPRDPVDFVNDIRLVLPRPVVLLSQQDAVAWELLNRSKTLTEAEALRTARTLCEEATALGYDPLLFLAVIHIESYYNHLAISSVGAEGLMQLMPPTAEWMADRVGMAWPEGHSFDPELNVRLGSRYLAHLNRQFGGRLDLALTAYNRGPQATRFIVAHRGQLPSDIHDFYAGKVLQRFGELKYFYSHLPQG